MEKLIEYSANSTVSQELVKTKTGTLTLFVFDAGQGSSEHSAPFDAIVQILDGEAELMIDGQNILTRTGETVLMPANIPHAVRANKKSKMLLTMIRG